MNKIFYDFETSGLDKWYDIPLDGAFILTDENLNKLDEYSFKIALPTGLMPSPIGLLVNKADLKTIFDGPFYFDAMADLHKKLSSWGPACYIGMNNINFDEHFMRQGFYKSMQDVYLTNTNGNTRADLLPILHCVKKLSPNALSFPETEDKEPIFKLDQVAPLNGFEHNAHNSMGDVIATIQISKIIQERCPTIWQSALECNSKLNVKQKAESMIAFCYGTYNFKRQADFGIYTLVGFSSLKGHEHEMLVFDLTHDLEAYNDASMEDMQKLVRSKDSPFRVIKINNSPILLPSSYASLVVEDGVEEKIYLEKALELNSNYNFRANAIKALENTTKKYPASSILEKQIYSGFVQPEDKAIIAEFLESFWEDKFHIAKYFKDPRMKEIAHLMIYHHKPEALPNDIRQQIAVRLAKRVTAPSCKEWRTGDDAMREIERARDRFLYEKEDLDRMESFTKSLIQKHNNIIKENL